MRIDTCFTIIEDLPDQINYCELKQEVEKWCKTYDTDLHITYNHNNLNYEVGVGKSIVLIIEQELPIALMKAILEAERKRKGVKEGDNV